MQDEERTFRISVTRLDKYVTDVVARRNATVPATRRGVKPPPLRKTDIMDQLAEVLLGEGRTRQRLNEQSNAGRVLTISFAQAIEVAEIILGDSSSQPLAEIATLAPDEFERTELPTGHASLGEIEILRESPDGNLITPAHHPVDGLVAVHIDDVRFRQKCKTSGENRVSKGRYVRIEAPSGDGAAVLPVDPRTGRVLLVTQYRHPQRRWLTEAPRGFSRIGLKEPTYETARRELQEETGAVIKRAPDGREELVHLKSLYTDTGKLVERPGYYLAYVDRELRTEFFVGRGPVMENPVWIPLADFYRAVFANGPIELEAQSVEWVLPEQTRQRYFASTTLDRSKPELEISDAFTSQLGFLALPHLARKCRQQAARPGDWFGPILEDLQFK